MNKRIIIFLLILSVAINVSLGAKIIYERNSDSVYEEIWNFSLNNAIFCFEQFESNNIDEGYYFAIGEIGTMINVMDNLDKFGEDDFAQQYFGSFYKCLVTKSESMKTRIPQLLQIFDLLQQNDYEAFDLIQEIVDSELLLTNSKS